MFPPPERPGTDLEAPAEYSPEERAQLLKLAHDAIAAAAAGRKFLPVPPGEHLAEPRGAFTTVYVDGELRGCVGYATAIAPLYRTVVDTAQAAAFDDRRFPGLRAEEVPRLQVWLSILSPLVTMQPEEVEIGRHGLIISSAHHRGLLLPQVPVEHGWDRVTFLEQTCRKAGLPLDAWRQGAKIEGFTAEVFGDGE